MVIRPLCDSSAARNLEKLSSGRSDRGVTVCTVAASCRWSEYKRGVCCFLSCLLSVCCQSANFGTEQKWQSQLKGKSKLLFLARLTPSSIIKCQLPRMVFSFTFLSWQTSQHYFPALTLFPPCELNDYTSLFPRPAAAGVVSFWDGT